METSPEERPPRPEPRSLQSSNWRSASSTPRSDQSARPRPSGNQGQDQRQRKDGEPRSRGFDGEPRSRGFDGESRSRGFDNWRSPSHTAGHKDRQSTWNRDRNSNSNSNSNGHQSRTASHVEDSTALAEGRRIYLGNILYHVRPEEITATLEAQGFKDYEQVHISVDPVSGRNPGYCFVEFETKDSADRAMELLNGVEIHGRSLKTGPCNPKSARGPRRDGRDESYEPAFNRWGDVGLTRNGGGESRKDGPDGAREHLNQVLDGKLSTRLYVGGLGKMLNQAQNDEDMRHLFRDFKIKAIGKRITAHRTTREVPGNHNYCFVDFESDVDAAAAARKLNGTDYQGSKLKINHAKKATKISEHAAGANDITAEFWGRPDVHDRP